MCPASVPSGLLCWKTAWETKRMSSAAAQRADSTATATPMTQPSNPLIADEAQDAKMKKTHALPVVMRLMTFFPCSEQKQEKYTHNKVVSKRARNKNNKNNKKNGTNSERKKKKKKNCHTHRHTRTHPHTSKERWIG